MPTNSEQDFAPFQVMDTEMFAKMPRSFAEYALRNPAILPDYSQFAYEMVDLAERHPDESLVLRGDHGTGKTTVLGSALLEAGAQEGYKPAGSISFALDMVSMGVYLDSHVNFADAKQGTAFFGPKETHFLRSSAQRQRVTEKIRNQLTHAGEKGLLIVDEGAYCKTSAPWLLDYLLEEAQYADATLVFLETNSPDGSRDINAESRQLSSAIDKPLIEVAIKEQPVNRDEIPHMVKAFGVEEDLVEVFDQHPKMTRLRLVSHIADRLALRKSRRDWALDDTVWTAEDAKHLLLKHLIYGDGEHEQKIFGLTKEEVVAIRSLLQPAED